MSIQCSLLVTNPAHVDASSETSREPSDLPAGHGSLLPEPEAALANVGQLVAELAIESAFARRKGTRDARSIAERAMEGAQRAELAALQRAADERYAAAKVEAWTQIGAGGLVSASAGCSVAGNSARNCLLAQSDLAVREGLAPILKGIGGLHSSGLKNNADAAEQAATAARYAASSLGKLIEQAVDDEKSTQESVRKALDFLREYESTRSQSQAAALHRA